MMRFSPPTLLKFLAGVLLVQIATAVQVVAALSTGDAATWLLFTALSLSSGVFAAFWFASIANHRTRETLFEARERFSRERERLRAQAERDKSRLLSRAQTRIARATNRARSRANLKTGAALTGLVGVGALLLVVQFFSLGLMALTTAGGALAGYTVGRLRDGRLGGGTSAKRLAGQPDPRQVMGSDRERTVTTALTQRPSLMGTDWAR